VWIDRWQLQCCGEPFTVGEAVKWTAVAGADAEFLTVVLGAERAAQITHAEEHHAEHLPPSIEGVVRSIEAVQCRFAPREGGARVLFPVPDSLVLTTLTRADGSESEPGADAKAGGASFVGYVVGLD